MLEEVRENARADFDDGKNPAAKSVDLDLSASVFDGTDNGIIDYASTDKGGANSAYLKVLENMRTNDIGGTVIIRFKTSQSGLLFGAGSSAQDDGTNMVFGIAPNGALRAYFRNSAAANAKGLKSYLLTKLTDNNWHTLAICFRSGETENAYVVLDGGENAYPSAWWPSWFPGFNKEAGGAAHPYVNFQVGGGVYNSNSFETYAGVGNFKGNIEFITVTDQIFTLDQLKEMTTEKVDLNNFTDMQAAGTANTWLMTGSDATVAKFDELGPVKNYVGFFEDNLRAAGTFVERSRFVYNTARPGLTIADINAAYDTLIAKYHSKAAGIMVDRSDYIKGESAIAAFKQNLTDLLNKIYADDKHPFLITPAKSKIAADNALVAAYTAAIKEVAAAYGTRVIDISTIEDSYLDANSHLTAAGHQYVANLIKDTLGVGTKTAYAGFDFKADPTTIKVDASPSVTAGSDKLTITAPTGYADLSWSYELSYNGQSLSKEQVKAPFTIAGLKENQSYTLRMISESDTVRKQLKDVTITTSTNSQAQVVEHEDGNTATIPGFTDLLNRAEPVTYLFMGDSITHGVLTKGYNNVPELFEKYLKEQGRNNDVVINTGVSNATLSTTLNQIGHRLNNFKPDVVMVMLGTNDASTKGEIAGSSNTGFTVDEFKSNYKELIRAIHANNPDAYIVLRVPCDMDPDDARSEYKKYFNSIYDVEQDIKTEIAGLRIAVIDHMKNWIEYGKNVRNDFLNAQADGWLADNVHPNARGNMAMFQQILKETGLYKNDSVMSNYSFHFSDWAEDSKLEARAVYQPKTNSVEFDMAQLKEYANGLKDVTVTVKDANLAAIFKTSGYKADGIMEMELVKDFEPFSVLVNGTDKATNKEIRFAAALDAQVDPDCTCAIEGFAFSGGDYAILENQDNLEIALKAAAKKTGNCNVPGHDKKEIVYLFEKAENIGDGATLNGSTLTVTSSATIKIKATAVISGTNASESKIGTFRITKEGMEKAVVFEKSDVRIADGAPTEPVDYRGALDRLKDLEQGTITVRYKAAKEGLMSLFSVSDGNKQATHTHVYINGGSIGYEVRNDSVNINNAAAAVENGAAGEWHTATYVFASDGSSIYFDGKKVLENGQHGFISSSKGVNTVDIGKTARLAGANNYLFTGDINFLEVRSDILTQAQILDLHKPTVREKIEVELPEGAVKTENNPLFEKGYQGSVSYRIPSLLTTKSGVILAAIDKRQSGSADQGNIDTSVRRSADNGKTWTEGQIVFNLPQGLQEHSLTIDPCMAQDEETGRIFMLVDMFPESQAAMNTSLLEKGSGYKQVGDKSYCILRDYESVLNTTHNYTKTYTIREDGKVWLEGATADAATLTDYAVPDFSTGKLLKAGKPAGNIFIYTGSNAGELKAVRNMRIWSSHSDDDGETWSKPVDLTHMFKEDWMLFCGVGPGRGIQVKNGAHKGRLLIPIYVANQNWTSAQAATVIYSDDHGETWQAAETSALEAAGIDLSTMNNAGAILTESQLVEMNDGTLIQFFRNGSGRLKYSVSNDSGTTWQAPVRDEAVPEVYCQLTAIHYPEKIDGKEAVILANPDGSGRNNGKVRIGLYNPADKTFEWKYDQFINKGSYAYSCLTVLPNGDIGLLYEENIPTIYFTSFNINWIQADLSVPVKLPEISNVSMAKETDGIRFTVDFNSYMFKMGAPVLKFTMDGSAKEAAYVSGDSSKQWVFFYQGDTAYKTNLTVTNVGAAKDDARSEIGNAQNQLPTDAAFSFDAEGKDECTCKIEDISLKPAQIRIPKDKGTAEAALSGSIKLSSCPVTGHAFQPAYTYALEDAGTTNAVVTDGKIQVAKSGTAKIRVTVTLNGKTASAVCKIAVTKETSGSFDGSPSIEPEQTKPEAKPEIPSKVETLEMDISSKAVTAKEAADGFFYTADGKKITNSIVKAENGIYILNPKGEKIISSLVSVKDGNSYITDTSGSVITGRMIETNDSLYYTTKATGKVIKDKIFKFSGSKYYASENGDIIRGRITSVDGKKYYSTRGTGRIIQDKLFKLNGKKYIAKKSGELALSNWVTIGKWKYYCNKNAEVTKVKKV